jgi:hypothetical protein
MIFDKPLIEKLHAAAFPEPRPFIQPPFDLGYVDPFWRPSQPVEPEPGQSEAADADDLPPVILPPARDVAAEVRKTLKPLHDYLTQLEVGPNLEQQRSGLFAQLQAFSESLTGLLIENREWKIAQLTIEQTAAAEECRGLKQLLTTLGVALGECAANLRNVQNATGKARAALSACEESEPDLASWPTAKQIADWKAQCAVLTEALAVAERNEADVVAAGQAVRARVVAAQAKLAEASKAEEILRSKLSGKPWADSETGLLNPPEV